MLAWYVSQMWLLLQILFMGFLAYLIIKVMFKDVKKEVLEKRKTARHSKR